MPTNSSSSAKAASPSVAEWLSKGIHKTYQEENLRYLQTAPLTMYDEANTKTNLPAQIDLYATEGDAYKFLFVSKGGIALGRGVALEGDPQNLSRGEPALLADGSADDVRRGKYEDEP